MGMKIGVIGDESSIRGFSALNVDIYPAYDEATIRKFINDMARNNYAVIFITEQAAVQAEETITRYATQPFPAIIPIPSNAGTLGLGTARIRKNVEKAVGTDIFFDGQ